MAKGGTLEYCTVDGCDRRRVGWGLCGLHYQRMRVSGDWRPSHRSQARAETISEDGTRRCFKCNERKPYTPEFFPADHRRAEPGALKGTCKACSRRAERRVALRRNYGLTIEVVEAMIASQSGRCGICHQPFTDQGARDKTKRPHIDHCHSTGVVRGILCHHCNVLLGHAQDSPPLLKAAIQYLERNHANA